MSLIPLEPRVQHYAWGDTRFIPSLLGRENRDGLPYAELWMGAHPDLPSRVGAETLKDRIEEDSEAILGPEVAREFRGELPFLVKVLSAAIPLSLQAHPSEEQARVGFLRENRSGIALGAPNRSYRDRRGKPELLAALTDFYAFVGFRRFEEIATTLEEVPELHRLAAGVELDERALGDLYRRVLALPQAEVDEILEPILVRLRRRSFDRDRREFWMVRCDDVFARGGGGHDRGLLSILFLNLVHLRPGEAVFLGPGVLHSYLEGSAVEIMASSNNVLRGGLTEKHVDVEELSNIVSFAGRTTGHPASGPRSRRRGPLPFHAQRVSARSDRRRLRYPLSSGETYGAEILLAVEAEGELEVSSAEGPKSLRRGECLLVTHGTTYGIAGRGTLFRAAVPDRRPRFRGRRPSELAFGTSGLRGLVSEMTDLEVYVNTRGFLEYLLDRREIYRGDPVSAAGDLRPSTERILGAVARAVTDAGFRLDYLGRIPTPALTWSALSQRRASVMVTGSHIPFDRNGVKFARPAGEVMKVDEAGILAAVAGVRAWEYARKGPESPFADDGMVLAERARPLAEASAAGSESYVRRYLDFFPEGALSEKRVVVYQHSAVGRDLLVGILRSLGADVLPMERSDSFIPIDTENISDERLRELEQLLSVARDTIGEIDAIVSTDGDSDRPLVVGIAPDGKVRFFGGDLLGILVADYLRADAVVVPVSANDAVDLWFGPRGVPVKKTRIGSPYVIEGMEEYLARGGFRRIVGFEANGGFLAGRIWSGMGSGSRLSPPGTPSFRFSPCCISRRRGTVRFRSSSPSFRPGSGRRD